MYKKASKLKLRFESNRGVISVEDLWDLPLTELNRMAKTYNKQLKENEEEDFLKEYSKEDKETKLKFEIVLDILDSKVEEKKAREEKEENKVKKQRLLELLEKKRNESMEGMTEAEIMEEIKKLS